ncbi:MAG: EF-Tu/IF-2/RF-3 family GTPase, partial [Alphaproteobacteria bacterium]|nr:EF-Tu/IF-2/RF-3 family GTPase [Alphaproteobacteria bacterium]
LDREGRDPFDLLQEIEDRLALDVTPASWPIGMGRNFHGCYDVLGDQLVLMKKGEANTEPTAAEKCVGLDDAKLDAHLPTDAVAKLREDLPMAQGLCPPMDVETYREGHLTPVYFGSAINNFGVRELLGGLVAMAPTPQPIQSQEREVLPDEAKVSGFVFKIQANMDPKHRDRIAFFRVASGHFKRGMKLTHVRTGKQITLSNPMLFLAQERDTAQDAFAGDIIGLPNHGNLRIGDTLTEGEDLHFKGIPSFAPELLKSVHLDDPMRAKQLGRALNQLAEEGVARVFRRRLGSEWVVGVLGQLQFEVMADRLRTEYNVAARFEATELYTARWVEADDQQDLKSFADAHRVEIADDHDGTPVFLARNAWHLDRTVEDWPDIRFLTTKEQTR